MVTDRKLRLILWVFFSIRDRITVQMLLDFSILTVMSSL
jgi:hypothetical protein